MHRNTRRPFTLDDAAVLSLQETRGPGQGNPSRPLLRTKRSSIHAPGQPLLFQKPLGRTAGLARPQQMADRCTTDVESIIGISDAALHNNVRTLGSSWSGESNQSIRCMAKRC
jgi:hypothetical protein